MFTDTQKIGLGLIGFGVTFLFLGIIIFDRGLLAIGNILFISGLSFIIGLERTFWFFFQRHKWKASGAFFSGIFILLLGWPLVGMLFEIYGFILLFRGFFPAVVGFLYRVPFLFNIFNLPVVGVYLKNLIFGAGRNNV